MKHLLMINIETTVAHAKVALSHGYVTHTHPIRVNPFKGGPQLPDIPSLDAFKGVEYDAVCVDHPSLAIRLLVAGFTVVSFEDDTNGVPMHMHSYRIDWEYTDKGEVELDYYSRSPFR